MVYVMNFGLALVCEDGIDYVVMFYMWYVERWMEIGFVQLWFAV